MTTDYGETSQMICRPNTTSSKRSQSR